MGQLQVQKVNWWHERLADWMLAHPEKNISDAASYFNCHVQTLYMVKNSDSFKQYWSLRSQDTSNAVVLDVRDKMLAVTEIALDHLATKLETSKELMPMDQLVGVVSLGMKSLGYTSKPGHTTQVQVNVNAVDPELLAKARERVHAAFGVLPADRRQATEEITEVTEVEKSKKLLPSDLLED